MLEDVGHQKTVCIRAAYARLRRGKGTVREGFFNWGQWIRFKNPGPVSPKLFAELYDSVRFSSRNLFSKYVFVIP